MNMWAWGDSCSTQLHHQTTLNTFFKSRVTPGHSILNEKLPGTPVWPPFKLKKITN